MPLTCEDMLELDKNSLVKFSLHTHYHQVLIGNNFEKYNEEITKNISFLKILKIQIINQLLCHVGFMTKNFLKVKR